MKAWMKFAAAFYALSGAIGLFMAVRYWTADQFMPYHAIVSGSSWESLTPGVQRFALGMLKIVSAGFLATSVTGLMLIAPVVRGEAWARRTALAGQCALLVPLLYTTLSLRAATGAPMPVGATATALALAIAAFIAAEMGARQQSPGSQPRNRGVGIGAGQRPSA
ncbi:MAG: hypothetical protein M5U30_16540 [Burkholderiaceae bacterium]|nr:hypothetical protein [Burkholderiaceae bacterium]